MEACLAHNQEVGGSNPSSATQENLTGIKKAERRKQKKEVFTMTKMTYAQAIDNAIALFSQGGQVDAEDRETVEKLEALKAQLAKRNKGERKPTKTQRENEGIKADILNLLTEEGRQCKDLAEGVGISGQKCSALLKQLVDAGLAEKFVWRRATYFKAVDGM